MGAQQRTLDDLWVGVNVQIDKGGHIRYRQQPQMGLPSVEIINKYKLTELEAKNKRMSEYIEEYHDEDFVMWCREQDALKESE